MEQHPQNQYGQFLQFRRQDSTEYGSGQGTLETVHPHHQGQQYPNGNSPWQQPQPTAQTTWDATQPEHPTQWHEPPSAYAQQSIARAENWVANQPHTPAPPPTVPTIASPPPKTPHSDFGTEHSYPFPPTALGHSSEGKRGKDRIWGIKRPIFFIIVAIGLFVLVVGVATGLGVGLALGRSSNSSAAGGAAAETTSSSSSSTSIARTTQTTPLPRVSGTRNGPPIATETDATVETNQQSATGTGSAPPTTFTGTVVQGPVLCPLNNNTVYISTGSSKPFNIQCGRDYNSGGGATDLTSKTTTTMAECIDLCGSRPECVGVGYGNYQGTYTCWMKSGLGTPNWSKDWYFATLQSLAKG